MRFLNEKLAAREAERIHGLFAGPYRDRDGFPAHDIDLDSMELAPGLHAAADFGDYAPFFMWWGKRDYVDGQFALLDALLDRDPLIRSPLGYVGNRIGPLRRMVGNRPHFFSPVLLFSYSDLLLGLILCAEMSGEGKYLNKARGMTEFVLATFGIGPTLSYQYLPATGWRTGIFDTNNALFCELLVDMHRLTGDQDYLDKAVAQSRFLLDSKFFRAHRLFPMFIPATGGASWNPVYFKGRRKVVLAKNNSSSVAALTSLYRATGDDEYGSAVQAWAEAYSTAMRADTGEMYEAAEFPGAVRRERITLLNFSFIDCLCDAYDAMRVEDLLTSAVGVGEAWLARQSETTGLLPWFVGSNQSWFDGETDMAISMWRLSELSGRKDFLDAAFRIVEGILRHHSCDGGFRTSVDIRTGAHCGTGTLETRYAALFMKALMLAKADHRIYGDGGLRSILRDR